NEVQNKPGERIADFWKGMFSFLNEKPVEYLVIDMRHNGGGNNYLNKPLVHGLIKCEKINKAGRLFVVVGRHTFSAAMNGAVDLERNTEAIFAGEHTGSSPHYVSELSMITLPRTSVLARG